MNSVSLCQISYCQTGVSLIRKDTNVKQKITRLHKHNAGIASITKSGDKLLATFVNQMAASAFELTSERLLRVDRGNARATRARQISIYLMHTVLSFPLIKIARIYKKDRTTIGHACRVIEDLRDNPAFDDRILELEETVQTVLKLASYIPEKASLNGK